MSDFQDTRSDQFKEFSGKWFDRLVEGVAGAYGGKAQNAVKVSPDEELTLWLKPTGPAAKLVYDRGGDDDEATRANTLWAHAMRGQQTLIRQQMQAAGATPQDIGAALQQQGLTDSQIFAETRRHAYELGKQNSHKSPKEEAAYHRRMADRAVWRQRQAAWQTVQPMTTGVEDADIAV